MPSLWTLQAGILSGMIQPVQSAAPRPFRLEIICKFSGPVATNLREQSLRFFSTYVMPGNQDAQPLCADVRHAW